MLIGVELARLPRQFADAVIRGLAVAVSRAESAFRVAPFTVTQQREVARQALVVVGGGGGGRALAAVLRGRAEVDLSLALQGGVGRFVRDFSCAK